MDTKNFLKEIRSIIREEIEYAMKKQQNESKKKSTNEKDLYMKIAQTHGFYCLMYRDYLWVNKFYIYLKNEV